MKSMKINKRKSKGKVHPSPSSSSSSNPLPSILASCSSIKDAETALNLLPATILVLITILTIEEREVLAYMIARSFKTTAANLVLEEKTKKQSMKKTGIEMGTVAVELHKPPVFYCGCFDCYTSYWFRWDSSPNRELIHQAIEAFEEHLASGEKNEKKNKSTGRGKRREKIDGRRNEKKAETAEVCGKGKSVSTLVPVVEAEKVDEAERKLEVDKASSEAEITAVMVGIEEIAHPLTEQVEEATEIPGPVVGTAEGRNHKGIARKVLPDVIGLLNFRFLSLWGPND